jgi:hypothetical protein
MNVSFWRQRANVRSAMIRVWPGRRKVAPPNPRKASLSGGSAIRPCVGPLIELLLGELLEPMLSVARNGLSQVSDCNRSSKRL